MLTKSDIQIIFVILNTTLFQRIEISIWRVLFMIIGIAEITTIDIDSYITHLSGMEIYNHLYNIDVERRKEYSVSVIDFSAKDSGDSVGHNHI